jgi:uncharacterized DUF497 family protein
MAGRFEWDARKAAANLRKHGVAFEEAQTIFGDPQSLTIYDAEHSETDDRFITLGLSFSGRLLVVVHQDLDEDIRIISARQATRKESRTYGNEQR